MYITLASNHSTFPFTSSSSLKTTPEANPIRNSIHCCYGCQLMGVRRRFSWLPRFSVKHFTKLSSPKMWGCAQALAAHPLVQSKIYTIEIKMCRLILRLQLSSILYNIAPCKPIQWPIFLLLKTSLKLWFQRCFCFDASCHPLIHFSFGVMKFENRFYWRWKYSNLYCKIEMASYTLQLSVAF